MFDYSIPEIQDSKTYERKPVPFHYCLSSKMKGYVFYLTATIIRLWAYLSKTKVSLKTVTAAVPLFQTDLYIQILLQVMTNMILFSCFQDRGFDELVFVTRPGHYNFFQSHPDNNNLQVNNYYCPVKLHEY